METCRRVHWSRPQVAASVQERGVGIAVAVQIGPGEFTEIRCPVKRLKRAEGAVAVVTEYRNLARPRGQNQVEVAVQFDVGRPDAERIHGAPPRDQAWWPRSLR